MSLLEFSFLSIFIFAIFALYKSITFKKSMELYVKHSNDIRHLDCSNEVKKILYFTNNESINALMMVKALAGIFYYEEGKKKLNNFTNKERELLAKYTIESIKTYFTYAPHWIPVFAIIYGLLTLFIAIFSKLDRLKYLIISPLEWRLIKH